MSAARRQLRRRLRTFVVAFVLLLFLSVVVGLVRLQELPAPSIAAEKLSEAAYAAAIKLGEVAEPELDEASGLARSHLASDRMWLVNDGGNGERLYAMGLGGEPHAAIEVRGARNDDWEALASYEREGEAYLLIADSGDNWARKKKRWLYAVKEPAFAVGDAPKKLDVVWTLPYRYEDGARDCEAVAVDAARGEILLLTKRDLPARLYSLALPGADGPRSHATATARFVTDVFNIPQPTQVDLRERFPLGAWLSQPTSLDIAPGGAAALVLTYGNAYRFAKAPGEAWGSAFQRIPQRLRLPRLRQAEAIAFVPGGQSFLVTSEQRPAPLYRYDPLPR